MNIDKENFEAWMERFIDRFDQIDDKLERVMKQKNWLDGEKILDNQDLCLLLNVTKRTLQRYRMKGILPYFNIDGRNYYRASDVHKLIQERL
jgi:hypothetical protein